MAEKEHSHQLYHTIYRICAKFKIFSYEQIWVMSFSNTFFLIFQSIVHISTTKQKKRTNDTIYF